jgi:hypothetical protein
LFGNAASVLVGDFLYSRAFQMMVSVGSMRVMEVLADATNTIAEGEVLQLMNCHNADIDVGEYLQVIRFKTAKLFEARRYQELNPATPEFIAIGVGGRPAAPERVYLVPARDLKFVTQYPSVMQKYELYPGHAVDEKLLRRILE